ncbi:hypothetical protein Tco_0964924, partial [Tanacetum coccineum]
MHLVRGSSRPRKHRSSPFKIRSEPDLCKPLIAPQYSQVSAMTTTRSEFNVINWEMLVILPTQVSFRSEELDGNYLCSRPLDPRWPYQRFESGMDVGDPLVA